MLDGVGDATRIKIPRIDLAHSHYTNSNIRETIERIVEMKLLNLMSGRQSYEL
jgi:hypothetical protein